MVKSNVPNKYPFVILTISLIAFILYLLAKDRIIINVSPSIPLGVYSLKPINTKTNLRQNDLVAFCLNIPYREFGLSRGYLLVGSRCSGTAPLLKSIIAVPGDNVTLTNNEIIVNNKVYGYPTHLYDSKHRPLQSWPRGNYKNSQGFWMIGTNSVKSWDSRYFGPIDRKQIIFLIRPLWIW